MIDVCFNPSIEGSLKACRAYGIMDDIQYVVRLEFMMDCGYILDGIESEYSIIHVIVHRHRHYPKAALPEPATSTS